MVDFHTHIIPAIDDGSHNVEESAEMLRMSYAQGIDTIVLTSHFRLGEHRIRSYLKDRREKLDILFDSISPEERKFMPKLILGAEVEFQPDMDKWDYLDELTINGTNFIMTEMPFTPWTGADLKVIDNIALNTPFTPIIPHIDRYMHTFTKESYIEHFYKMPVVVQMNAIYINSRAHIQYYKPLLDSGKIQILGSDCHGPEWRPPNLGTAIETVKEVCGQAVMDRIEARSREMLKDAIYEDF